MTKKRFEYYEHKGADYILDTPNKSLDFIEMLGDCLEAEEIVNLLNELHEERNYFERKKCEYWNKFNLAHLDNIQLRQENEQLKQRNDRQAKRLAELYELMAKKDWESLTEIIDDFCSCEEQLQREWRTYE